eukprot:CAMPEP_0198217880 /NCGR_PEP_ID=MMETSP1445-20131203/66261_1 /TAXON_ID=36898 /ORGANISM="Pyramimonas sp., Strain CCMP2087" /LENGTH=228 /DNA_ID=CAMNT_0043894717 /DNA_START=99 /DNA_END=782 /DNA_ORIENTATION=+
MSESTQRQLFDEEKEDVGSTHINDDDDNATNPRISVSPSRRNSVSPTKRGSVSSSRRKARKGDELPSPSHRPERLIRRNPQGGIVVDEQEVKDAFRILNPEGREVVSREDLSKFVATFFPGQLSQREIKTLVGVNGMKFDKLKKIVTDNDIDFDFDPCAEAFKVLDPHATGTVDTETVKTMLETMPGISEISSADLEFLLKFMDCDGDGQITLEDFASIGHYGTPEYD